MSSLPAEEAGWRMLAFKDRGRVRLVSRQGVDHTARFPEPSLILDREVAVFDEKLVSRFHLLTRPVFPNHLSN